MNLDPIDVEEPAAPASAVRPVGSKWVSRGYAWCLRHPVAVLLLVSLLGVVVNCHPVIFFGRSFVSPASAAPTIFDWWPPSPAMNSKTVPVEGHVSDTGAMMFWDVPVGFIQARSVWEHGALPFWNRYGHAGDTLIGQGVSMLGDPLQLIIILGHGSAVAWDFKFLAAKVLFCVGFGGLIFRVFASRSFSLLYAALAAYCGAFFYINNHPAFFVFAYAPWILLSALTWLDRSAKGRMRWALGWLLANFACFNAGHVEVAVDLIGGLNLAALVYALAGCRAPVERFRVLTEMAVGTVLFLGLTSPVWLSFLAVLSESYNVHARVEIVQLPPALMPGIFDDLFFLLISGKQVMASMPGTSLLVLTGCVLSALKWRQCARNTFFWVNLGALFLWGGCVFGWVPHALLLAVPLLNRVGHTHTDFGYLLVIHLMIQSAFGFKCLAEERKFSRAVMDLLWTVLVFLAMFLIYIFGTRHDPIPWGYFLCAAIGAIGAPWLFVYLKLHYQRVSLVGWCGIVALGFLPHFRFASYTGGRDDLLMIPGPRVVLDAPLPSVRRIQDDHSEPFRVVGLDGNLGGDYSAVFGLEDIRSCAPLSNGQFINLLRNFPGIYFDKRWLIEVRDPVSARPLLNFLNVKYLLADPQKYDPAIHGPERHDFKVLKNQDFWPRAFFVDKVLPVSSDEQFIDYLLKRGQQPFVALARDEMGRQPGLWSLTSARTATIVAATNYVLLPNSTEFDIHCPSAGVVCLTEGQPKNFMAIANGEPKAVLTVNQAFKGIWLDRPGDYHVEFSFRPPHWGLSVLLFWISAISAVGLAVSGVWRPAFRPTDCEANK